MISDPILNTLIAEISDAIEEAEMTTPRHEIIKLIDETMARIASISIPEKKEDKE